MNSAWVLATCRDYGRSMSRLPFFTRDQLDEDQRRIWEGITSTRGAAAENDVGGLIGPFNSMLFNPEIGGRVSGLGAAVRFGTSLPQNLLEVAIITVGAHWRSNFEFWAHARMAHDAGVEQAVIDAIRDGATPAFSDRAEALVHDYTSQLLRDTRVEADTYGEIQQLLGDSGVVELTTLIGYYCLISLTLNAFEIELPGGREPIWPI